MKELKKKRSLKLILMLTVLLTLLLACGMTSQAASAKSKAMKAYKTMMAKTYIYKDNWQMKTKNCYFAIAYIDNNSVPELIVYNNKDIPHMGGYGMLYTYRNGKVQYVTSMTLDEKSTLGYYRKKGILTDAYAQQGRKGVSFMKLKNGTVTSVLYKGYYHNGKKWKADEYLKYSSSKVTTLTKSKFNKALKSYVGSRDLTKFKFYKNTSKNRKKYLK